MLAGQCILKIFVQSGLTRSRVFGFVWLGPSGAFAYGPCPTGFCARSRPTCIRSPVVALDREISLDLKTHTKYSTVPSKCISYWNDAAWMVPPHRGGRPVFPLAQNGYMSCSQPSYGTVRLIYAVSFCARCLHIPACLSSTRSTSPIPRCAIPRHTITPLKTHHVPACSFVCKFPSPDCSSPPQISRDSSVVVTLIWGSQGRTRYVSVSTPLPPPYSNLFPSPLTA